MVLSGVGVGRGGGEGGREKGVAGKVQAGVGSETGAVDRCCPLQVERQRSFPNTPSTPSTLV
jgi:hypothetical protein